MWHFRECSICGNECIPYAMGVVIMIVCRIRWGGTKCIPYIMGEVERDL